MTQEAKAKIFKFKHSIFNKLINLTNILFIFYVLGAYIFYFILLIFFSGFGMWGSKTYVGAPSFIQNVYVSSYSNLEIELVDIVDEQLRYTIELDITLDQDLTLRESDVDGYIQIVTLDNTPLTKVENSGYYIPLGEHHLHLVILNDITLDVYEGVTSFSVILRNPEATTLSPFFQQKEIGTGTHHTIVTADSTGDYVNNFERMAFYKSLKTMQALALVFTAINIIKGITFSLLTTGMTKKLKE